MKLLSSLVMLLVLPLGAFAQAVDTTSADGILKMIPDLFKALQSQEALPVLVIGCNLLMALLKTPWFQSWIMWAMKKEQEEELTEEGKTFLALILGVVATFLLSPASTGGRTLIKGMMIGWAVIGFYHSWKHSLKKVFFKAKIETCEQADSDQKKVPSPLTKAEAG